MSNENKGIGKIADQFRKPNWFSAKFAVFCVFIVLLYILNHNAIESDMRREAALKKEIKDLNYERIRSSAKLMEMSKQSEVLNRMKQEGLRLQELTEPPRIIE